MMRPRLPLLRHLSTKNSPNQLIKPFESIPGPEPLPLVGNIWRYLPLVGHYQLNRLYENALYNRKHYGPIVREQIFKNHTVLHLFDPDDIKTFTKNDGQQPHRRSHRALLKYRSEYPERYNDGGLFPENGEKWLRLRRMFKRYLMSRSQVYSRAEIIDQVTLRSIESLHDRELVRKFDHFLNMWSLKCSLAIFLDYRTDDFPSNDVLNTMIESLHDELDAIDGTEMRSEKWTEEPSKCPFFQKLSKAEDSLYNLVSDRIEQLLNNQALMRKDVSYVRDWLLKQKFDRKDVITFILDCILAGLHTTAYTTTFLLEYLSNWDPLKRNELRRQVHENMPPITEYVSSDITDEIPVLINCFKETLRLRPVAIGTGRMTQKDMIIRDYQVPKGVMVIAHNQAICMDPAIYENPEQFQPERWSGLNKSSTRPSPFARMPFGFGPRICIGQQLVSLQINILAARMLQQFEWKFVSDIKTKSMLVHCLVGDVDIELKRLR